MSGDIYICEEKTIIDVLQGLKFQPIPRAALNNILPPVNVSSAKAVPAKPTEIAPPQRQKNTAPSKVATGSKKATLF